VICEKDGAWDGVESEDEVQGSIQRSSVSKRFPKLYPWLDQLTESKLALMHTGFVKRMSALISKPGPSYALLNTLRRDHHILRQCCGKYSLPNMEVDRSTVTMSSRKKKDTLGDGHPISDAVALYRLRLDSKDHLKQPAHIILKTLLKSFGKTAVRANTDHLQFQRVSVCLSCWAAIHGVSKSKMYQVIQNHNKRCENTVGYF